MLGGSIKRGFYMLREVREVILACETSDKKNISNKHFLIAQLLKNPPAMQETPV